jgi:hypothetical protein
MIVTRYSPEKKSAWDTFVRAAKNSHFMHSRDYMDYHADRFSDHSLMLHDADGKLIALLPANEKDGMLYSHQGLTFGGFITSADTRMWQMIAALDAVAKYAKSNGLTHLVYKTMPSFYHQSPASEDIYALFLKNAVQIRADVSTTIDYAARIPFSTLRKRGAKKALKEGVMIRRSDDFSSFHAIISGIVEEKYEAQVTHSESEMKLLADRFPDNIKLYGAYVNDTMCAGVLVFETATVAHAQYIGASDQGRELGALDLLFSELIERVFQPSKQAECLTKNSLRRRKDLAAGRPFMSFLNCPYKK